MPIKPPNLDDRRYADIVREARALIPQYCPEWTNLGDADPGMTLVQLFAWMTEMTIYRLNRVPDKTYIHFLNFIGEERREAQPGRVPLTFQLRGEAVDVAEIPPFTRASTKQLEGGEALHFLTVDPVSVHDCNVERIVAVHAGPSPMVREIPFDTHPENAKAMLFGGGGGVQFFKMDEVEHGPRAYTPYQFLYVSHEDFRLMNFIPTDNTPVGRLRIRTASSENLPVGALFRWEFFTGDMERPWVPLDYDEEEEEEVLGLPEIPLKANLERLDELDYFGDEEDPFPIPGALTEERWWIRGTVDYERWMAHRMGDDLEITWRDDRGGEERPINNWDVRATGRNLEFNLRDMPPIRPGWTIRFTLVDRSLPAGRSAYLPRYRWTYRRGEQWEEIPMERVLYQGTSVVITGPLSDMATDGFNLRAERIETVNIRSFIPDLDLELVWMRPVELTLGFGPDSGAVMPIPTWELPALPFQTAPTLPPLLGMKFFIGSDLFENRAQKPVMIELEVSFDIDGEDIEEPRDKYTMQLTYRATDTWRVVYTPEGTFTEFTFADLDEEGALEYGKRKIRILINPREQLKSVHRSVIAGKETAWLRLELTRSLMTFQKDKKSPPKPITMKIHSLKLGVDGIIGRDIYEQPMPGPKMATVEYREHNRRLTRAVTRSSGRLAEHHPFDTFIDVDDAAAGSDKKRREQGHSALYFKFDQSFPLGQRHAVLFKTRGETFMPEGMSIDWEMLESLGHGRLTWTRLVSASEESDSPTYMLNRSGVLAYSYTEEKDIPEEEGMWLRALFRAPTGGSMPALPPLTHAMINTVEAVNLHAFRMEKFSGMGVPHQDVQLRRFPLYLHPDEAGKSVFTHPDRFADIRVYVTEEDGVRREWRRAPGNSMLTTTKDDRVFTVSTVDGVLRFGNGIRGKMVPVGNFNIVVEVYHTIPGESGNVGPNSIQLIEGFADITTVQNLLPATGGRNAESIEEIIRRAPSILTSRDRAVTRLDFEIIAKEASGEVSRAACDGRMASDGQVEVVILPMRRPGERIPDTFMSAGLKDHVQRYLAKRCLVNVQPVVRLATFKMVDVSVVVRLRPNANMIQVRDQARKWVETFLDPYDGGIDGSGWPFHGTLYAQDFGRMTTDIHGVRHVVDVQLYEVDDTEDGTAGWERGEGAKTVVLEEDDLLVIRNVRVVSEEGDS